MIREVQNGRPRQYGLEKRLPLALQFVSFGAEQRAALKKASGLPKHIEAAIDAFERGLTDKEMKDPAYRISVSAVLTPPSC